ncbi:MAG: alpha/beta hydrolase, partial [Rhodospirillales bacterium]|nr:alpha/beta hydrolase [Rhodospirillales bacterium]
MPAIALAAAVGAGSAAAGAGVVEDVKSPRGPTSRILVEKPANAWVTLLVFTGGQGDLRISDSGEINNMKGNFLIRTNGDFVAAGAVTAIIDAPSDRSNLSNFRDTEGHARDIGAVIRHLKAKFKLQVWVIGTSNGSTSAANAGALLAATAERPDGVV